MALILLPNNHLPHWSSKIKILFILLLFFKKEKKKGEWVFELNTYNHLGLLYNSRRN